MFSSLWLLLLPVVLAGGAAVWLSRWAERQKQQQRQALQSASTVRGWSCDTVKEGAFDLTRWQGQTDGVHWTAEYRRQTHKRKDQRRVHCLRWWADGFLGPGAPVLLMGVPKGKEAPAIRLAQGDGLLASLAQQAAGFALDTALDMRFGAEVGQRVDARALRMVEGEALPGFIAMAADTSQGAFWLDQQGQRAVIETQLCDASSALSDERDRPWVLWLDRRVLLTRQAPVGSIDDLERLVRAGVALVRSSH